MGPVPCGRKSSVEIQYVSFNVGTFLPKSNPTLINAITAEKFIPPIYLPIHLGR